MNKNTNTHNLKNQTRQQYTEMFFKGSFLGRIIKFLKPFYKIHNNYKSLLPLPWPLRGSLEDYAGSQFEEGSTFPSQEWPPRGGSDAGCWRQEEAGSREGVWTECQGKVLMTVIISAI